MFLGLRRSPYASASAKTAEVDECLAGMRTVG